MSSITNAVAIFGATGGLGEAVAERLAKEGAVTLGYFGGKEKCQAIVERIEASGGQAIADRVDMKDSESVRLFLTKAKEKWGRLDAIVSATGPAITLGPLVDSSAPLFDNIIHTDVIGSYNIVQQGVPILRNENRATSIVLFVTCAVLKTLDFDGLSFIPKKAVEGIIKQTAREVGKDGIRVNGIAPGVIDAGIVLSDFTSDKYGAAVLDTCSGTTPMGRRGKASEVAEVVEFLTSHRASYVTGQIIGVDGGYSA